ncbi:hypothetical protein Q5530_36965 [Saccharothrix sp. BKS2]|uniref:hypothetical protein n=1 Tax=Saccharothrix sp. BKS2 TaxID=3064400 RepID=UPI0039ECE1CB
MRSRLLTGLVVTALVTTQAVADAATAEPVTDLASAVTARMHAEASGVTVAATTPRVNVTEQDGEWAFGTAVLATAPGSDTHPTGWLFVAHRDGAGWEVALEGEPAFADLAAEAPVMSEAERPFLTAQGRPGALGPGDWRTGMALPFAVGQSWGMPGCSHGWSGAAAPWNSLDLAGGDHVVRAARGGAFLGNTGTDVTCGGSASGRHVHFALRQNNAYTGIVNHDIGKWVLQNGVPPTRVRPCTAAPARARAARCTTTVRSGSPRPSWTPTAAAW